ncbi:unnamed protein product [Prunus armeniaca]
MGTGAGVLWEWGRKNHRKGTMGLDGERGEVKKSVGAEWVAGGGGRWVSGFCLGKGWVAGFVWGGIAWVVGKGGGEKSQIRIGLLKVLKETNGVCLNLLILSCIVLIFQVEVIWTYFDMGNGSFRKYYSLSCSCNYSFGMLHHLKGDGFPGSAQGEGWVVGCGLWVVGCGEGGGRRTEKEGMDLVRHGGEVIKKPRCTKLLKYPYHVIELNGLLEGVNDRDNVEYQTLVNGAKWVTLTFRG